jgi:pimeloyl-ACP methyl ester carboxylesterase
MLPARRPISLPAGQAVVRELPGPPGAPPVVLLHGLGVTTDVNFYRCYPLLGERFRVLAIDHRGHGDGIRTRRPFRLVDCADDVVAMADAVGIERFVAVGYSMGGAVAQHLGRRHPDRLSGIVLCATASRFSGRPLERLSFIGLDGLAAAARLAPATVRRTVAERYRRNRHADWESWALEQTAGADWRAVLEAGGALGRFRSDGWVGSLEVPVAVVLTLLDAMVPPARQRRLAELIPTADVFPVDGGHDAAVTVARFPSTLVEAIDSVLAHHR